MHFECSSVCSDEGHEEEGNTPARELDVNNGHGHLPAISRVSSLPMSSELSAPSEADIVAALARSVVRLERLAAVYASLLSTAAKRLLRRVGMKSSTNSFSGVALETTTGALEVGAVPSVALVRNQVDDEHDTLGAVAHREIQTPKTTTRDDARGVNDGGEKFVVGFRNDEPSISNYGHTIAS